MKSTSNGSSLGQRLRSLPERMQRWRFNAYQRDLEKRGWYALSPRSEDDAIFVGGCGRSGTTLFREILNRHSRIACGPETSIFGLPFNVNNQAQAWSLDAAELEALAAGSRDLVGYAERFYRRYLLEPQGKTRWADKTPNNVRVISRLLTWFPRGRFIHLIRDGRDVACSLRNHPKEKVVNGKVVPVNNNHPISKCATRWLKDTATGLAFRGHPRCLEVRYEDLVDHPESEVRRVCAFLGEEFEPAMLDSEKGAEIKGAGRLVNNANAVEKITGKSVSRWRRDLSPAERQVFVDVAGELLIVAGYVPDHSWARS